MKWWLGAMLMAGAVGGVWGQAGERLGLRVQTVQAEPGEAQREWVEEFWVDDQGRLARIHRVTKGEFVDDPAVATDIRFSWDGLSVAWSEGSLTGRVVSTQEGLRFSLGKLETLWRFTGDSGTVRWEDGLHRNSWNRVEGYQSRVQEAQDNQGGAHPPYEYITVGSRLTRQMAGKPRDFVLLDRRPRELGGVFYGLFVEEQGWVPAGTILCSGPGLWHLDPVVRQVHALVLDHFLVAPVWPALVFEKSFLK